MMKRYTRPAIEIIVSMMPSEPLAASPNVKGDDFFRWGNGQNSHGNDLWVNENYAEPLEMGGDDDGDIDSRAKGGGGLWDE